VFCVPQESVAGADRIGVRIGDHVLDLAYLVGQGLVDGPFAVGSLNDFMALGPDHWSAVRSRLTDLLCDPGARTEVEPGLYELEQVVLKLPFEVADYVDFYSSLEHATNLGRLLRPGGEPLLPNWRHLPVGYHGRAGTVVPTGTPVTRPCGQLRHKQQTLVHGPTTRLDIELEVAVVIGVPSELGERVPIEEAPDHVFGVVLVNDWSARDIQAWEYQPLGPFLGKSFATSVAAWVTPLAALEDARVEGPVQDPVPLDYLRGGRSWGLALDLSLGLCPAEGGDEQQISSTSFAGMYWQFPQQIAHLTTNGASLRTGDLLASGTVSGPERGSEGSLMELTWGGAEPIDVAGHERSFLEDGDEVVLRGSAVVDTGVVITLGEVRGQVRAANADTVEVRRHEI
jgi:fumarylacetoacetase